MRQLSKDEAIDFAKSEVGYSFTATQIAGSWEISSGVHWQLQSRPNWRTRMMARLFLGWKWTDA